MSGPYKIPVLLLSISNLFAGTALIIVVLAVYGNISVSWASFHLWPSDRLAAVVVFSVSLVLSGTSLALVAMRRPVSAAIVAFFLPLVLGISFFVALVQVMVSWGVLLSLVGFGILVAMLNMVARMRASSIALFSICVLAALSFLVRMNPALIVCGLLGAWSSYTLRKQTLEQSMIGVMENH